MSSEDRRRAVRAPAKLAMEIKLGGDATHVESINVSANGVYFISTAYIPLLTKLQITLMLPDEAEGGTHEVTCQGVVVRTVPEDPAETSDPYEVACYFTSISSADQEHLESYILRQLAF